MLTLRTKVQAQDSGPTTKCPSYTVASYSLPLPTLGNPQNSAPFPQAGPSHLEQQLHPHAHPPLPRPLAGLDAGPGDGCPSPSAAVAGLQFSAPQTPAAQAGLPGLLQPALPHCAVVHHQLRGGRNHDTVKQPILLIVWRNSIVGVSASPAQPPSCPQPSVPTLVSQAFIIHALV